jgi:hypothetical protein
VRGTLAVGFRSVGIGAGSGACSDFGELLDGSEEMRWREVGVTERHADVRVPKQLPHGTDVYALITSRDAKL